MIFRNKAANAISFGSENPFLSPDVSDTFSSQGKKTLMKKGTFSLVPKITK